MLKVGFVETLQAGNGSVYLLVKTESVTRQQRSNVNLNFDGKSYYKSAPGCGHCEFASGKVSLYYPALLAAHKAALQVASQSRRHTTTAKNHSQILVDLISEITGQTLPQPSYVPETNNPGSVSKVYSSEIFVEGAFTWLPIGPNHCSRHTSPSLVQLRGLCAIEQRQRVRKLRSGRQTICEKFIARSLN